MTKAELFRVMEAVRAARLEFETLVDEDIHVASGRLYEQLEDAARTLEKAYANAQT